MNATSDPGLAVRNIAALLWRRAAAIPKRFVRAARRMERAQKQADVYRTEWQIERELAAVARGRGPIIAGPWLSEVGFEVLYWIPFLRWFEDRFRVDRERVIAISRGGVGDWYRDVAAHYVEIFDHVDPATFARRNAERRASNESGGQKQTSESSFDAELITLAQSVARSTKVGLKADSTWKVGLKADSSWSPASVGPRQPAICHPSLMYRLFNQVWLGNRPADVILRHTSYEPIVSPPCGDLGLPAQYIAAKFYTGAALPDTAASRQMLRDLVHTVASQMPVVMLDAGMTTDEHEDFLFRDIPNVISLRGRLEPRSNLGVQTAVTAASQGFIGTCGSLAWLAPLLGVRTVGVYADDRLLTTHLYLARQMFRRMNAAPFETLDLRAAQALDALTPAVQEVTR